MTSNKTTAIEVHHVSRQTAVDKLKNYIRMKNIQVWWKTFRVHFEPAIKKYIAHVEMK